METLEHLGIALGLASLAGVNLYLTVLIVGLAVRFDWLTLGPSYQTLEALGHPWVLTVAGVFFVMEFFADKVPWLDSLWDTVHTVIRPVGGTLLALQALGDMPPYMEVLAALIAGGAALTTHGAKAGSRLLINHSPEPVSNVSMSLAEDVGVVGGTALVLISPVVAFGVFLVLLVVLWTIFPVLFRIIRSSLWLVLQKIRMPGHREPLDNLIQLKPDLPLDTAGLLFAKAGVTEKEVGWTVECLIGRSKGIKGLTGNLPALLVVKSDSGPLHLVVKKLFREQVIRVPIDGANIEVESRLLSDNLTVHLPGRLLTLRFPRGRSALVETVAIRLRELSGPTAPPESVGATTEDTEVESNPLSTVPSV